MRGTNPENKTAASATEILSRLETERSQGKTLVTTNGCFDILHSGHIRYLIEAAALGDILIVGVNADATVRRLKGADRPLQSEDDRVHIVAALEMVDFAFVFPEDDPRTFIEVLKPDFHVKGGDYSPEIIERPTVEKCGGKVAIVSFVNGRSTTGIIGRMNRNGSA